MKNRAEYKTLVDIIKEENLALDMTVTPHDPLVAAFDYERDHDRGSVIRYVPGGKIATPVRIQREVDMVKCVKCSRDGVFDMRIAKPINLLYDADQDLFASYDGNHTATMILLNSGNGFIAANVSVMTPGTDAEQLRELGELFQKTNEAFSPLESYTKFRMKVVLEYDSNVAIWNTLKDHGFNLFCKKDNPDKIPANAIGNISNVNGVINLMEKHWSMIPVASTAAERLVNETAAKELSDALKLYRDLWPNCAAEWPTISHFIMLLHRDRMMGTNIFNAPAIKAVIGGRSALEVHKLFQKAKKDTAAFCTSYLHAYKVAYSDAAIFAKILIGLGYSDALALPSVRLK